MDSMLHPYGGRNNSAQFLQTVLDGFAIQLTHEPSSSCAYALLASIRLSDNEPAVTTLVDTQRPAVRYCDRIAPGYRMQLIGGPFWQLRP
jgi:hypothetical protein